MEDINIQQTKPKNVSPPVVNAQPNQRPTTAKTTQEQSKRSQERRQKFKPKIIIPTKPQTQTKITDSDKQQLVVVRTAKPVLPINEQPKTVGKPKRVWKPPPPKQSPVSNPNSGLVDAAKPWESKAPIRSASDELEDVIRGEKND